METRQRTTSQEKLNSTGYKKVQGELINFEFVIMKHQHGSMTTQISLLNGICKCIFDNPGLEQFSSLRQYEKTQQFLRENSATVNVVT